MNQPKRAEGAFTLIELLVVMVVIAVLVGLLLPELARHGSARPRSRRMQCMANQKQVGLGFRLYAADNEDRFPMRVVTNTAGTDLAFFYQILSNELSTPKILVCPSDRRAGAVSWSALHSSNLSYFIGMAASEAQPQVWLLGDRNLATNGVAVGPGLLQLRSNLSVGWTTEMHDRCGNVALGDGSVQVIINAQLQTGLAAQVAATNELLVP